MTEQELNAVRELNKKIRALETRLRDIRNSAENIVPILDGLPKAAFAKSRVEKTALKAVEVERELETLRGQLPLLKSDLANRIMAEVDEPIRRAISSVFRSERLPAVCESLCATSSASTKNF